VGLLGCGPSREAPGPAKPRQPHQPQDRPNKQSPARRRAPRNPAQPSWPGIEPGHTMPAQWSQAPEPCRRRARQSPASKVKSQARCRAGKAQPAKLARRWADKSFPFANQPGAGLAKPSQSNQLCRRRARQNQVGPIGQAGASLAKPSERSPARPRAQQSQASQSSHMPWAQAATQTPRPAKPC
jgi:hypothetical protein